MPTGTPKAKAKKSQKYDGRRGENGSLGCWRSLEDAKDLVDGKEDWWKADFIRAVQHTTDVPRHEPVWMFENGDMYFGEWKMDTSKGWAVEHGMGVSHFYDRIGRRGKGRIYAGNWKDGQEDGVGEVYWLKSSNVWQSDHYPGSAIKQRYEATGGNRGVPFHYKGRFSNGCMVDEKAVVTLKDGTSRMGPWKNNEPVGRWDEHTLIARPVQREVTEEALRASQEQRQMKPLQAKKRKQPLVSVDRSGKLKRDAEARERIRIAAVTPSKVRPKKHENQKKRQRAAVAPTASVHGTNLHPQQQAKGSAGPHDKAEETNRKSEATENKDTEPHNKARRTSQQASHEDADNRKRVASSSVSARVRTQGGNSRPSQRSSQNQAAPRQISSRTDVNRIYDSDTEAVKQEEDTSPLTETSASAAVPPTVTEKQRRIDQISEYITHQVIRNNPNPITIAEYAEKLYGLGFESVEMIRAYLKPRHIQSFDWLTFLHKEIFLERLESSS